jgi:hypothetical protein
MPAILGWWETRGEGVMPNDILPPHGFLASDAQGPALAAWLYLPLGVPMGIVDWLVGRPGMSPAQARAAGWAVFEAIEAFARAQGVTRLFCSIQSDAIAREAERAGFRFVATNMYHLTKDLA